MRREETRGRKDLESKCGGIVEIKNKMTHQSKQSINQKESKSKS